MRAGEDDLLKKRRELAGLIDRELGPFDASYLEALVAIDRAPFARPGDEHRSTEDVPLALDDEGLATVSAPHAYLLSFRLAELRAGDHLVELGSGSGFGAALASRIVGPSGRVTTLEIDPVLASRARALLADRSNVTVHLADAVGSEHLWGGARRVICTFAVASIPDAWIQAIPEGGTLVAPVARRGSDLEGDQRLVRLMRLAGDVRATEHGGVRYVKNRSSKT